jgi:hypothetical protein
MQEAAGVPESLDRLVELSAAANKSDGVLKRLLEELRRLVE